MKNNKLLDGVYKEFYIKDSNKRNIKALPFKNTIIKMALKQGGNKNEKSIRN